VRQVFYIPFLFNSPAGGAINSCNRDDGVDKIIQCARGNEAVRRDLQFG
jgi:hypothetical protein